MKNLSSLNESNGITLYAYSVNGKQVTSFMKLSELENEPKPAGAIIVKAHVDGAKF